MSVRFCDTNPQGFHNFTGRGRVCSWCHLSSAQLKQQERENAAAYMASVKKEALSPEHLADLDAMRPYVERRKRFQTLLDATTNLAAYHFDALPPAAFADVRADLAAAVEGLGKAIAGVTHPEIRESLYLSKCLAEQQLAAMQARWEAVQQRRAAA